MWMASWWMCGRRTGDPRLKRLPATVEELNDFDCIVLYDPDPNLLRVHMGHIRRKLEVDATRPKHFITDSGMGYRFDSSDES